MSVNIVHTPFVIDGVRLGSANAGIKPGNTRHDLTVIELAEGSTCAAAFTRNAFCAAPVVVAREHLAHHVARYLLINSGNANAGTGDGGLLAAKRSCTALADLRAGLIEAVLPFSTGVIGEPLPVERLEKALPAACEALSESGWDQAARAIMTTDTVHKIASVRMDIDGREIRVTGMAKGSGMIHPDMATMLAYVATDAAIPQAALDALVPELVADSFNCITVDGDTSTNDACVLMATGRSPAAVMTADGIHPALREGLQAVFDSLAQQIIRDGEGATKFITIDVEGGESVEACRQVAFTIAHSPLVKTAFFASDPNWGRILAAVGRAGLPDLDISRIEIDLDDVAIVRDGGRDAGYTEAAGARVMAQSEITIRVRLCRGAHQCRVWTTDLSYDYVKINAEYRT
ncbi:MAG: bifunctional glutamate N-acetyltransferase/amino-acid acetyltransferase ArgJ [Gammaproteobacteria bacterium]|nr:bifunctional glutamate N-acetyltransferase/amino-acid acetyltransferase ArgJ [Gammaproteobacteria bacterium]